MLGDCCDDECVISDDDYNRSDGAMGADYTLLSGTAPTVSGNKLDFSAAGFVRHNTIYPGAAGESRHASAKVKFSVSGGFELAVGLTDKDNYFAASLTFTSSGCSVLSSSMVSAGSGAFGGGCAPTVSVTDCVKVPGLLANDEVLLEVCLIPNSGGYGYETYDKVISKVTLPLRSGESEPKIFSCTMISAGPAVGQYAGLRATAALKADDFKHTYFRNSPDDQHKSCPNCNTPCRIGSDSFTTDEPCNWQVSSGSYTVSGGRMLITANGTVVVFNQFHPGLKTAQIQTGRISPNGIIHRPRVGSGYMEFEGSDLRLYDNTTTLLQSTTDSPVSLVPDSDGLLNYQLCYSQGGILTATVSDSLEHSICVSGQADEQPLGYWASVGGNNGAIFDDVVFKKSASTDEPKDGCEECVCLVVCAACFAGAPRFLMGTLSVSGNPDATCPALTTCGDLSGVAWVGEKDETCSPSLSLGCVWTVNNRVPLVIWNSFAGGPCPGDPSGVSYSIAVSLECITISSTGFLRANVLVDNGGIGSSNSYRNFGIQLPSLGGGYDCSAEALNGLVLPYLGASLQSCCRGFINAPFTECDWTAATLTLEIP